ncbi:hypothetical protein HDU76_002864 [Blyttiomyces sp. JEL0837]|nr:hypothetical protein HDU76_002864 [Blyttiomyces sp. JEL0837]
MSEEKIMSVDKKEKEFSSGPTSRLATAPKTFTDLDIEDVDGGVGRVPTIGSFRSDGERDEDFYELYDAMKAVAEHVVEVDANVDKASLRTNVLLLSDERANPNSDQFDHQIFMKAARQFMNQVGLDYARMPVVYDDLKVYGNAVTDTRIPTVGSTLKDIVRPIFSIFEYIHRVKNKIAAPKLETAKELIHGISGTVKPGELVLVIGRPGSGCSTLLRVLTNRTSTFKDIKGRVCFGGLTPAEIHDMYRGEVVYAEENDPHYPSLTVRQTLEFALACRVPSAYIRDRLIPTFLKLYGLVNCQNTVVGDELLRGVSGGEKKRVSLAEATCIGGSVAAFDGCTKGLDSASALDFVKGLRNFADFQGRSVLASCYQSSDAMFDLFDKVIVLSEGHCVYQGPTSEAIKYFESLGFKKNPRDTKAEFLTVAASSGKYPASELGRLYAESAIGKVIKEDVQRSLDPALLDSLKTEFKRSIIERKKFMKTEKMVDSPFNVPFKVQARLLLLRELQIIRGNPVATIIRFIFAMLMALIVGSVFFKLPVDTGGTYTRGGVIFFALLFSSTSALAEVPKIMGGRPVLYKHVDFALYRTSQSFSLLIKAIANGSEDVHAAHRVSGLSLMLLVINTGYIVPEPSIHPWFIWTCTLAGAKPGEDFVDGASYLQAYLNMDPNFLWWNLLIILGFWVFFLIMNCVIIEVTHHDKAGVSVKLFKEDKHKSKDPEKSRQSSTASSLARAGYTPDPEKDSLNTLTWRDVVYKVPHPKDKKSTLQLLSGVSAYAKPGTLTALMGSSGAGKTTMLDVVAQRKTIGTIDGTIFVGSNPQDQYFKRISGYCEQMDVHNRDVTKQEKNDYCEYVIDLLDLRPLADALIGDLHSGIGLTMEERKRLTIGVELAAKPKIIFLDEPTSGLDEQASLTIIKLMKNLAAEGHALLVTIHQPSAMLFTQFDRLLLLGRGGKMIYFGDLGNDCSTLINYFEKNGAPKCDPTANPAEYMLECIGAGTAKVANTVDWFSTWNVSPEYKQELSTIDSIRKRAEEYSSKNSAELQARTEQLKKDFMTDFEKTNLVLLRMFRSYWRSVEYNVGRVTFQAPNTPTGANNRVFAIFMTSILGVVVINLVQPMFFAQREYAIRETGSGTYGPISFAIAITTTEIPFAIIATTAFYCLFYFTVGLNLATERAGFFYICNVVFGLWAVSYGQLVASFSPNEQIGSAIIPITTSVLSLFSGTTIPYESMPAFYRGWLYWIDPYHYFIEGLIVNELGGLTLTCDSASIVTVKAPPGKTCYQYFAPYLTKAPGQLLTPNATESCQYCPMVVGNTYYEEGLVDIISLHPYSLK